ncbi:hypothetical protein [Streptomyces sp. NPDC007070]
MTEVSGEVRQSGIGEGGGPVRAADAWEVGLPLWADAAGCGPCHPGDDSH